MNIEEAKKLQYRDVVIDDRGKRWYVTGKVQLWKRDPKRVRIPIKHGLYVYGALTENNLHRVEREKTE